MKTHLLFNAHGFTNCGTPSHVVYYGQHRHVAMLLFTGCSSHNAKIKVCNFPDYIKHIYYFKYDWDHKTIKERENSASVDGVLAYGSAQA